MSSFPPDPPHDVALLTAARDKLVAAKFDEETIARRLGLPHLVAITLDRYPAFLRGRLAARTALDVAIALFLLQDTATRAEVEALFGEELAAPLVSEVRLLAPVGRGRGAPLAAQASLYPCLGGLFATDHRFRPSERALPRKPPPEPVMYLGEDSYALACGAMRPPKPDEAAVLDLCTGSGVHAILAAVRSGVRSVVGTDRSERAVRFARVNAALNGLSPRQAAFLVGDLDAPLGPGSASPAAAAAAAAGAAVATGTSPDASEADAAALLPLRFDAIFANPPFVPSPVPAGRRLAFRDAGPAGEEVLASIVSLIPRRLKVASPTGAGAGSGPGPFAEVVTTFVDREGTSFRRRIESWLGRGADLSTLVLRLGLPEDPLEYALAQTRHAFEDTFADFERRFLGWAAAMRRAGVRRISGGILVFRPNASRPAPPFFRDVDAVGIHGLRPFGQALERTLHALDVTRGVVFLDEVLDLDVEPAADLVVEDHLGGTPPEVRAHRASAPSSLAGGEVAVSSDVRLLLFRALEARRAPLRALLAEGEPPLEPARVLPAVVELIERGLLVAT